MDLLSFLPLPREVINEIVSYGYCHPVLEQIKENYQSLNIVDIFAKNNFLKKYNLITNYIIRDQIDDMLYYKYYTKGQKHRYNKLIKIFYDEDFIKNKNYKNFSNEMFDIDFPILNSASVSSYSPHYIRNYDSNYL